MEIPFGAEGGDLTPYTLVSARLRRAHGAWLAVFPHVLHIPLCLLMSMIRRDIAGINETGQSHGNYLTME